MYKKIIFVCTGNTCRSPMAEVILRRLFENEGIDIEVISRGLNVFGPMPANDKTIRVMERLNNDLTSHIASQFFEEDVSEDSLVLTMTRSHKKILTGSFPEFSKSIFTLKEYVNEDGDVADPFGSSIDIYEECAKEIEDLLTKLLYEIGKSKN